MADQDTEKHSNAYREKPAEDRIQELADDGITEQRQIAGVLMKEHYNPHEIAKAMGLSNMKEVLALAKGPVKKPETVNNGRQQITQSMPEDQPPSSETSGYKTKTERGAALAEVLGTVSGINPKKAQAALTFYESHQEDFDNNPMRLMGILTGAGLSWIRARDAVTEFLTQVEPDTVFSPYMGGSGSGGQQLASWMMPYAQQEGARGSFARMDAFMDKLLEYRLMGRLTKEIFNDGGEGEGGKDDFDKGMDRMMKAATIRMLTNGGGGGFGQPMPGMAATYEPVLDEDNKPILDEHGQPVMKVHYDTPGSRGNGDMATILQLAQNSNDIALRIAEIMRPKDGGDSSSKLTDLMLKRIDALSDNQIGMLQKQVDALNNQDPLGYVSDVVDKLRKLGGFGDKGQNLEVAKLSTDLEKWEFDKDQEFKRWAWEQRQVMEDKKYSRKQLEEFGRTIREGIEKVGGPVAQGFKEGYSKGLGRNGQQQPERTREKENPKDMTDEELDSMLQKVNTASKTVEKARENLVAELRTRGRNV